MHYQGIYKGTTYCISESKRAIKTYMKYHRGLKRNEFEIKKISNLLGMEYDKRKVLEQFYGYYLPRGDCRTILRDVDLEMDKMVEYASESLHYFDRLTSLSGHIQQRSSFRTSLDYIDSIARKPHIMEQMRDCAIRYHWLIFCPMEEYIECYGTLLMQICLDEEYREKMERDE